MRIVVLTALLWVASTAATAEKMTEEAYCKRIEAQAMWILEDRLDGVTFEEAWGDKSWIQQLQPIVIAAYKAPAITSEDLRSAAVDAFSTYWFDRCMDGHVRP